MGCRSGRPDERGSVFVEAVLILPLLFALLLGITTGGAAYGNKISVVEAVREGARFGASLQLGSGPTAVADFETAVKNRVVAASGGSLSVAGVCAKLVLPTGGTDCGLSDPSGASAEPLVHLVKVSATRSATIQFFFFSMTASLNGRLTARYERDTG
jgi:Flp pilus assembly protein TadG